VPAPSWPSAPPAGPLAADEVHVWCAVLERPAAELERLARLLSGDEQERAARFRLAPVREQFVVARACLRSLLGGYLGVEPGRVVFSLGPQGKPRLASPAPSPPLFFNLSHSHGLALVALALVGEVGVDVEQLRPQTNNLELAERFFSPPEAAALRALPAWQREEAFFHVWTRKEAFMKATGFGLSHGLERSEMSVRPGEAARLLRLDGQEAPAARWSLQDLAPAPGYVGALALEAHGWRLSCRTWNPAAVP
jgi:4'-phosphopantetheinyl transferase